MSVPNNPYDAVNQAVASANGWVVHNPADVAGGQQPMQQQNRTYQTDYERALEEQKRLDEKKGQQESIENTVERIENNTEEIIRNQNRTYEPTDHYGHDPVGAEDHYHETPPGLSSPVDTSPNTDYMTFDQRSSMGDWNK